MLHEALSRKTRFCLTLFAAIQKKSRRVAALRCGYGADFPGFVEKKCRPETHPGARTGHVFYHLSNSREALRCHRNPFKLPRFAEMAFLGAWALLARCPSGKKRGLCVHQEASRGDIFSPRTPGNPRRSLMVAPRHAAIFFVSPRKVSCKIVFFARDPYGVL